MNNLDRFDLNNQNIIITGAAGKLGFYHAIAILEKNGNPILIDKNKSKLIESKKKLESLFKKKIIIHKINLTNFKELKNFFKFYEGKKIYFDALINNADINSKFNELKKDFRIESLNLKFWEKHIQIGLTSNFLFSSLYYIHLLKLKKKGQIINISSDLGIISPDQRIYFDRKKKSSQQPVKPISYSVTKHGIIGLTKYFSTYNSKIMRCNTIAFGGVKVFDKNFEKRVSKLIPLKRMANEDEYITTVQYLLSKNTSYLNGSTLVIDGGRTII